MMLGMGLFMALCATWMEIKAVSSLKPLEKLYENGWILPGIWYNFAFSLALSAGLGFVFGASGVTIMLGGVASTAMSAAYFRSKVVLNANGITYADTKEKIGQTTTKLLENKSYYAQTTKDLIKVIKVLLMIITFPVKVARQLLRLLVILSEKIKPNKSASTTTEREKTYA